MAHPSIAIIGAGIAGLTTALTLQDAGFASMLYEASERLGGRIHSDTTTWDDALVLCIFRAHQRLIKYE